MRKIDNIVEGSVQPANPAFAPQAMTGFSLEMWRIKEHLINWDTLFALGFTSYAMLINHAKKHQDIPLDPVREILVRLYMISPEFPRLFISPPISDLLDYLFNLNDLATDDDRKRCISLLAPILGRNRGSGYRWLRNKQNSENPVSLPIRRLSAKIFSMNTDTARSDFWKVALITARARSINCDSVVAQLQKRGVVLD